MCLLTQVGCERLLTPARHLPRVRGPDSRARAARRSQCPQRQGPAPSCQPGRGAWAHHGGPEQQCLPRGACSGTRQQGGAGSIAGPCGRTVQAPTTPRPWPSQARHPRSADTAPHALGPAPGLGKQACPGREEPIKAHGLFSSSLAASHFKMKIINTDTHRLDREREIRQSRRSQGARTCAAWAALTGQRGQGASEPGGCKQTGAGAGGARPGRGRSPRAGLVPGSWWHQGPRGWGSEQGTRLVTLSSVAPAPAKRPP